MASFQGPLDPAAGRILTLAVQAEQEHRYVSAYNLYTEGIQILFDNIRGLSDARMKTQLRLKVAEYLDRAEELKRRVEAEKKKSTGYHEQIVIEDGSVGYGLERLFRPYLDEDLTEVEIDDPYIRANHQRVDVRQNQLTRLEEIRTGLMKRNVHLFVEYSDTLHDREIRFNNGWLIKIGRGLDYFKRPDGQNSVDFVDLDFRSCLATTVDVVFSKPKTEKNEKNEKNEKTEKIEKNVPRKN